VSNRFDFVDCVFLSLNVLLSYTVHIDSTCSSEMLVIINLHGVTAQKNNIYIFIAMKTLKLIFIPVEFDYCTLFTLISL
jgi:hypothetical protein